jgi:hypothetical protein
MRHACVLVLAAGVVWTQGALAAKHFLNEFDVPGAANTYVSAIGETGLVAGVYLDGSGHAQGYMSEFGDSFTFYAQPEIFPETIGGGRETAGYTLDANGDAFVAEPDGGAITTFAPKGTNPNMGASAEAMDGQGNVAGYYYTSEGIAHGFLRAKKGKITAFDAPGAGTGTRQGTYAYAIGARNVSAGYTVDDSGVYHGFVRAQNGNFTIIDVAGAGTASGQGTRVLCMSPADTAGGYYQSTDNTRHGFLRDASGNVTAFDVPGAVDTVVRSVNKSGVSVGFYVDASGVSHGFERKKSGKLHIVDAPDAGTASGQGTTITSLQFGDLFAGYYIDSSGNQHGFVGG